STAAEGPGIRPGAFFFRVSSEIPAEPLLGVGVEAPDIADQLLDQSDALSGRRRLARDVGDLAAVFEVERPDRLHDARRLEVDVDDLSLDGLGLVEGLAFRLLADVVPGRFAEIAPRRG